jgi:hypothetical protein
MEAIRERQWAPSDDGVALTRDLLGMMQSYFPGRAFDGLPGALIRYLAGDHCADLLGVASADHTRLIVEASAVIAPKLAGLEGDEALAVLLQHAAHMLMEGIVLASREGKNAKFRIPKSLLTAIDPKY